MLIKIEKKFNKFMDFIGNILIVMLLLMILNVFYDVVMRYAFHDSSIAMQELEWHFFSIIILFGTSYSLKENAHVRVDFLYDKFSTKTQAIINIVGTIFFLLPFTLLIIYGSYTFFMDSYSIGETSGDPGGLKYLWAIKAMIPISFILLFIEGIVYIIQNINIYRELEKPKKVDPQGALS
ncbi:TRAP transporter small permease subunit [Sulfurospirillum sp. 1612]|uniref:TRAP transporter small permease subunit n=1 Tax=Sulfurospirillum sp. 1612 TaxID=3094835 RepID=UPI002F942919